MLAVDYVAYSAEPVWIFSTCSLIIQCIRFLFSGWFQLRDLSVFADGNSSESSCGTWLAILPKFW